MTFCSGHGGRGGGCGRPTKRRLGVATARWGPITEPVSTVNKEDCFVLFSRKFAGSSYWLGLRSSIIAGKTGKAGTEPRAEEPANTGSTVCRRWLPPPLPPASAVLQAAYQGPQQPSDPRLPEFWSQIPSPGSCPPGLGPDLTQQRSMQGAWDSMTCSPVELNSFFLCLDLSL